MGHQWAMLPIKLKDQVLHPDLHLLCFLHPEEMPLGTSVGFFCFFSLALFGGSCKVLEVHVLEMVYIVELLYTVVIECRVNRSLPARFTSLCIHVGVQRPCERDVASCLVCIFIIQNSFTFGFSAYTDWHTPR